MKRLTDEQLEHRMHGKLRARSFAGDLVTQLLSDLHEEGLLWYCRVVGRQTYLAARESWQSYVSGHVHDTQRIAEDEGRMNAVLSDHKKSENNSIHLYREDSHISYKIFCDEADKTRKTVEILREYFLYD